LKSDMTLQLMRHRAVVIGASLHVAFRRPAGMCVTCTLPLHDIGR
jgi:hypothetical protein